MLVLIVIAAGFSVALLAAGISTHKPKKKPGDRLEQYINARPQPVDLIRKELEASFWERVVVPRFRGLEEVARRLTPAGYLQTAGKKLEAAGVSGKSPAVFVIMQAGLLAAGVLFGSLLTPKAHSMGLLLSVGLGGIAALAPSFYLGDKARKRSASIARQLPDVLDLLTVSVEAGLGFDGALAKVVEKMPGPLSEEFSRALRAIRMGEPRRTALRAMADRSDVADLKLFIGSIVQGDQLGISISKILRVQSEQMRINRKQRAQEAAMKAPIKMLFPLILFVFPALFVVLLGPAAIRMIQAFSQ